jgi:membrane fusion protein, multidrug efflux system
MTRRARRSVLAVSALVLGTACSRAQGDVPGPTRAPIDVRTAPIIQETLAPVVSGTGTLGPKEEVPLSFKVGGVVARVQVDAGALVRAGDTLAVLELREIAAAVTRARSAAEKAERDLARARRLYADSVATLSQVQDAETAAEVARADWATASFNERYAAVVAPGGGVVLRRQVEPGELVAPGQAVLVLGSRARGTVLRVGLSDRDVARVARGDSATVRFDAAPARAFPGRVSEIGAAAEPLTGAYTVEIALPAARGLAAGLVGQVEIRPGRGQASTVIPIEAVLEADGDRATVFVLSADGRRAQRRQVELAFLVGDRVAIAGGLAGARTVVTEGAAYLDDGDEVRVRP